MNTLNEEELAHINAGGTLGDYWDDAKKIYHDLKNGGYKKIKDFGSGFAEGLTSQEFH